jgi:hypothetical protein
MKAMLSLLLLLGLRPDLAELNALAQARDARGLLAHAGPALQDPATFRFLQQSGAFGTGSKGWTANDLNDPVGGKSYVVFGTPLTTQDYGEFVFEFASGKLTRLVDERDDRGYKVLHYDFDLRFQPAQKRADVAVTVKLRRKPGAQPTVHFRLSPHYRVSAATTVEGTPIAFSQASGVVSLAPPAGEETSVKLRYSGVVDMPQFAGSISASEVMLTNDYWWPMVARGPATVNTTAHVPADWTVVTHGKKTTDVVSRAERTVRYEMSVPISYLSLSAAAFQHEQKKVGQVTYHVWSREMSPEDMRTQLELMPSVIEFYERFAPFPFEDFGAVVTSVYGGGALEAYSYATYGTGWLPDEDTHEPAHTWWGGLIPNTYFNSFWNESFAVYSGGLYAREVTIGNNEERRRAFVSQSGVSGFGEAPVGKAGAFDGGVASAMGYGKGSVVLQQLEREIGTEKMVAAMKKWIAANPKGEPGEWGGFQSAVEATTGQRMEWFFDQWIAKPGAPQFQVTEVGWSGGEVRGLVDFAGDPYRLTTEVYVEFADGTSKHLDAVLNPERKTAVSAFSFKLDKKPALVAFDPYDRIPRNRGSVQQPRFGERASRMRAVIDPRQAAYGQALRSLARSAIVTAEVPADLNGVLLIGHPDTMPELRDLCAKAGFAVNGDKLTYKGTTVDLDEGGAVALIELGPGRTCAIGLGTPVVHASTGSARVCVFDKYGRFLRGETAPRREGSLAFRVP